MVLVKILYLFLNIYSFIITSKENDKILINNDKFNHTHLDNLIKNNILHINRNQLEKLVNLKNVQYIAIINDDDINLKEIIFNKHFINSFSHYNSSNVKFINCEISLKIILNLDINITIINSTLLVDTDIDLILTDANDIIKFYFTKKSNFVFKNITVR